MQVQQGQGYDPRRPFQFIAPSSQRDFRRWDVTAAPAPRDQLDERRALFDQPLPPPTDTLGTADNDNDEDDFDGLEVGRRSSGEETENGSEEGLAVQWPNETLDNDTFGLAICSIVRDFALIAEGKGSITSRVLRLVTSFCMLSACIGIQVFIVGKVKTFLSDEAVHHVRRVYSHYEETMYGNHTRVIDDRHLVEHRGIGGPEGPWFNESFFHNLSPDLQEDICRISLSQPDFIGCVLLIWTVRCFSEMRRCMHIFDSLILRTKVVDSMRVALEWNDGGAFVAGLTVSVKVYMTVLILLPRIGITAYLLWAGCRLLLAQTDFSELILNAVALEFILVLKNMLYLAFVPRRTHHDIDRTEIVPARRYGVESTLEFVGTFVAAGVTVSWVLVYMGTPYTPALQNVLIDYQWDVRGPCEHWIAIRYAV